MELDLATLVLELLGQLAGQHMLGPISEAELSEAVYRCVQGTGLPDNPASSSLLSAIVKLDGWTAMLMFYLHHLKADVLHGAVFATTEILHAVHVIH